MMSLWDALRMNMMISYQELVRTFLSLPYSQILMITPMLQFLFYLSLGASLVIRRTVLRCVG